MTADQIMEQVRKLPRVERKRLSEAVDNLAFAETMGLIPSESAGGTDDDFITGLPDWDARWQRLGFSEPWPDEMSDDFDRWLAGEDVSPPKS